MLRKLINSFLVLPFSLYISPQKAVLSETKNHIDEILQEKEDVIFLDYSEIKKIRLVV